MLLCNQSHCRSRTDTALLVPTAPLTLRQGGDLVCFTHMPSSERHKPTQGNSGIHRRLCTSPVRTEKHRDEPLCCVCTASADHSDGGTLLQTSSRSMTPEVSFLTFMAHHATYTVYWNREEGVFEEGGWWAQEQNVCSVQKGEHVKGCRGRGCQSGTSNGTGVSTASDRALVGPPKCMTGTPVPSIRRVTARATAGTRRWRRGFARRVGVNRNPLRGSLPDAG